EQALLGAEIEEHGPLRDANLARDVLDMRRAVSVLGEPSHRGLDGAALPLIRLRRSPGPTLGHRSQTVAHEKEPEGPSLTFRRSVRFPSVPRAQLPELPLPPAEGPDPRPSARLAAPFPLRRPPTRRSAPRPARLPRR